MALGEVSGSLLADPSETNGRSVGYTRTIVMLGCFDTIGIAIAFASAMNVDVGGTASGAGLLAVGVAARSSASLSLDRG